MRRPALLSLLAAAAVALPLAAAPAASAAPVVVGHRVSPSCSVAAPGSAGCLALRSDDVDARGQVVPQDAARAATAPRGFGPADLRSAYGLGSSRSGGRTVAVVNAYDAPTAEADLAVYRSRFGLAPCRSAGGCFRKVDQDGGQRYPAAHGGWAQETSLDLDMVSATCPDCRLLLVEARSASFADLSAAVDTAVRLGASAVSNSYGGADQGPLPSYDHPGVAITASSGDSGYGVLSPASSPSVVAVGGTTLRRASNARGWSETAWSGAGSGCSSRTARPSWQTGATSCPRKAVSDVSAVADPATGVAVYDSYAFNGARGWQVFGGTSVSSPVVAAVYALAGRGSTRAAAWTWAHRGALNDVTAGSNGSCSTPRWCRATKGWDGPTGLGSPRGTGAF